MLWGWPMSSLSADSLNENDPSHQIGFVGNHFNVLLIVCFSEYGEKWHNGGKVLNKQNSYDDFIAAAEYLVQNKYTSPAKYVPDVHL